MHHFCEIGKDDELVHMVIGVLQERGDTGFMNAEKTGKNSGTIVTGSSWSLTRVQFDHLKRLWKTIINKVRIKL